MNNLIIKIKNGGLACICMLALFTSCNKLYTDPTPLTIPVTPAGNTLAKTLAATASDSLYYRLVVKSGILTATPATITDSTLRFTMFVPDNNAMKGFINAISGGAVPLNAPDAVFSGFITANISAANALAIVSYNTVPQSLTTASFPTSFPNLQYATIFNPAPSVSPLLRLATFPSKRGTINYVNNIPLASSDAASTNGIIHHPAAFVAPPSVYLWNRIDTSSDMTYFRAAIIRADSGTGSPGTLQSALLNIGASLTTFVPTDSAMKAMLTLQITGALIAQGVPPATAQSNAAALASSPSVFSSPATANVLTPTVVKGLVAYHILPVRVFTVNMPTTATGTVTLLGASYPSVTLQATFTGATVSAATVKGAGNAAASSIYINPFASSDQNYLNGVLHKINQVLLPQ